MDDEIKLELLIYQRTASLPSSDPWQSLPCTKHKTIYAGYAEINGRSGGAVEVRPGSTGNDRRNDDAEKGDLRSPVRERPGQSARLLHERHRFGETVECPAIRRNALRNRRREGS